MIAGLDLWFWACLVLSTLSFAICIFQFLRGAAPDDYSQGSVLVLEAFLMIYLVGSIIMQALTDGPSGDWLEFYGYLITAMIIPAGTFIWSLTERSRWSTLVLGLTGPVLIIMLHRMNMLWYYY
ncbi:hypothetical protein [Rothia sp. P100]|uniref:hypothetical protein n=1 Tax=unclassified Rothia (in: high G+C Gram-positive bacteria) TaxID=2689056 RepID=UPI0009C6694E|nr:hypothetical protein [Rothia sp. P100]MCM3511201.1 hypothetical protein [Rothia sp. P100]SLE41772.1 Uncharacterised protein [Mycobacteroides abscessus subsp. bolletii]HCN40009.1 hypothetical protein [Rothia sp. (in: high G+C Gram-positive bacteria)]